MKVISFIIVIITAWLLLFGVMEMPKWADPNIPPATHVSPRYIEKAVEETATPNVVTAVLADYRGYDTLGETTVIFSAGVCCMLLLRKRRK